LLFRESGPPARLERLLGLGGHHARSSLRTLRAQADFETLDSLGVELDGKIVVARYGGNFRGFTAKYAEEYAMRPAS